MTVDLLAGVSVGLDPVESLVVGVIGGAVLGFASVALPVLARKLWHSGGGSR